MMSADHMDPSWAKTWVFDSAGPIEIGSDRHRRAFCRMLLDTYDPYKPAVIDWPALDAPALARITSLPIWYLAVETENTASARIGLMAAQEKDPLIREALELMAFEEKRHRMVLDALITRYGIRIEEPPPYVASSRWTGWNFMSTGYGECLDSFFAFGLFELARQSGYFPPELVETFEPVIQEEARHIVFFVNWASYVQANRPLLLRPLFMLKRMVLLGRAGLARAGVAFGDEENFATDGRDQIGIDIDLGPFIDLCLHENARRMSVIDARLLRPAVMPTMARFARRFMRP